MPVFAHRENRPGQHEPATRASPRTATPEPDHARVTGPAGTQDFTQIPVHSAEVTDPAGIGPGQPVPAVLREQFERVTRRTVGSARVHTSPAAQHVAETLEARALTIGRDIHFAPGQFQPGTPEGDHLLVHELTHVVQQRGSAPAPQMQLESTEQNGAAEIEADQVADAVLDDDETEAPVIAARAPMASMVPKKKKAKTAKKTAKPKPITFSLFSTPFKASVDAANNVTVTKAGKSDGGWAFTAGGPNQVQAERTLDHAEYVHVSGKTESLVERCTVNVPPGGPATHTQIVAELGSPPALSIPLAGGMTAANRKSVTVNGTTLTQLDLPATAITFAPDDGDTIHLGLHGEAWAFTTLQSDPVPPATTAAAVRGFFRVGTLTSYLDHGVPTFGIDSPGKSDAALKKEMDDLASPSTPSARRITSDEAEMFKTVALMESDLAGVQTYDSGILSFGVAQWTVNSDLPRVLLNVDAATFERYLGRYGLAVGTPVLQLDSFVHKFVGGDRARARLGVRTAHEGALFLNGKELVNKRLLDTAKAQGAALGAAAVRASAAKADLDAAKPELKSEDASAKAAAVKATAAAKKEVRALRTMMTGLSGMKTLPDLSAQAELLAKVATDGATAANTLLANSAASEVMRGEEWALRFEMLGQSPGGQDAEVAGLRADWANVSGRSTHGAAFATLLPNLRGRATLLSSFFNNPSGAIGGVGRAVDSFKATKQQQAKAAAAAAAKAKQPAPSPTEADWKAFPWPSGDARWTTLWTNKEIDEFEAIAILEMTRPTTSPTRRREIIKAQFP
jgi:hypothetical protein